MKIGTKVKRDKDAKGKDKKELFCFVPLCLLPASRVAGCAFDGFAICQKAAFSVIPAQAGIQSSQSLLDSRLRGSDDLRGFSRVHHA